MYFLHSHYLVSFRPKYLPQHPVLEYPQRIFVLQYEKQVSHPYKTRGTIIVLCILIYIFWITKWKTKDSALNDIKYTAKEFKEVLSFKNFCMNAW